MRGGATAGGAGCVFITYSQREEEEEEEEEKLPNLPTPTTGPLFAPEWRRGWPRCAVRPYAMCKKTRGNVMQYAGGTALGMKPVLGGCFFFAQMRRRKKAHG